MFGVCVILVFFVNYFWIFEFCLFLYFRVIWSLVLVVSLGRFDMVVLSYYFWFGFVVFWLLVCGDLSIFLS